MHRSEGWKAVWISIIDNYDDLDEYTDDTWDENGERVMSPFATEFGIQWYDPDAREFDLDEDAKSFDELFSGISHEDAYIRELLKNLADFDPRIYKSFMILHDYKYELGGSSEKAIFIGNYKYK